MSIESSIRGRGGFAKACELQQVGHSPGAIRAATASKRIIRVRKGWYTTTEMPSEAIRAFRVGGVLACASAAQFHGLWVLEVEALHLCVPRRSSRLRTSDNHRRRLAAHPDPTVTVHWMRGEPSGDRIAVSLAEAILQVFECQGSAAGFIVLESALRKGRLETIQKHELLDSLSRADRDVAALASASSDSGTESLVKMWLLDARVPFVQQKLIPGVGPVDFLVGSLLVIEVDSKEFHSDAYRDRHKDAELSIRGFRVLRFMYSQVVHEWPHVEAAIRAALARGDHL